MFESVTEMNETMIERWNSVVRPNDIVWHLGDYAMGPDIKSLFLLKRLNGEKHLIVGNHDKPWPGSRDSHKYQATWTRCGWASVQAFARRRVRGENVMLSHLPYEFDHTETDRYTQYRLRDEGLPLIHGHVHDAWTVNGRQINVGVDVRDFTPVHLDTIAGEIERI